MKIKIITADYGYCIKYIARTDNDDMGRTANTKEKAIRLLSDALAKQGIQVSELVEVSS